MRRELYDYCLKDASLNWSLRHIIKYGDTDLFPAPFEFKAYESVRQETLRNLSSINLAQHTLGTSIRMMIPKGADGFRAAIQMDPLDCILYTALIYEMAPQIESARIPTSQNIACSYRLELSAEGQFFRGGNGWKDFHKKSEDLASQPNCRYVITADISDFYNQISHHRTQNALAAATIEENKTYIVENILGKLNSLSHSRGIPVGPSASNLLAEACLSDVDNFLVRKQYSHTRYVDDFRIFCRTEQEARQALHDLTECLHTTHRLSLQGWKTKIQTVDIFTKNELHDPEQTEQTIQRDKIAELMRSFELPYGETLEDIIDHEDETEALRETINDVFAEVIKTKPLPISLARYLLRRATALRTRVIMQPLLDNIEHFLPVFRDVAIYLIKTFDRRSPEQVGPILRYLLEKSTYREIPFIQYWVLEAFCQIPLFCASDEALRLAEGSAPLIRERMPPLIAKTYKIIDWVRSKKEMWASTMPWAQRAIIWSSAILPKGERMHWLNAIEDGPSTSTGLIIKAVKMLP